MTKITAHRARAIGCHGLGRQSVGERNIKPPRVEENCAKEEEKGTIDYESEFVFTRKREEDRERGAFCNSPPSAVAHYHLFYPASIKIPT